jgi:hypothetical protein
MIACPVCKTPIETELRRCGRCGASLTQRLARPPSLPAPEATGTVVIDTAKPPTQRLAQPEAKPPTQRLSASASSTAFVKPATQRVTSSGTALHKPSTQRLSSSGTALMRADGAPARPADPTGPATTKPGTRIFTATATDIIGEALTERIERPDTGDDIGARSFTDLHEAPLPEVHGGRIMFWVLPLGTIATVGYDYFWSPAPLAPFWQFMLLVGSAGMLFGKIWALVVFRVVLCIALGLVGIGFYEQLALSPEQMHARVLIGLWVFAAWYLFALGNCLANRGLRARYD